MSTSNETMLQIAERTLKRTRLLKSSPFAEHEHIEILSAEQGKVVVKFEVTENLLNLGGVMHGGLLCYLVDVLTCLPTYTLLSRSLKVVSLKLHTNFVKGIRNGETVYATAVAVRAGEKIAFAEVHFRDAEGNLRAYGGQALYIFEANSSPGNSSSELMGKSKL